MPRVAIGEAHVAKPDERLGSVRRLDDRGLEVSPGRRPVGAGGEERVPFSTLDVVRYGVIGIPPGGEQPVACLTPAGRWMPDRDQRLEYTIRYTDGEGVAYEESIGFEYLA